jgi:hypothetical protein
MRQKCWCGVDPHASALPAIGGREAGGMAPFFRIRLPQKRGSPVATMA